MSQTRANFVGATMNLCIVTTQYPSSGYKVGGIATYFERVAHHLVSQGHTVSVCVRCKPNDDLPITDRIAIYPVLKRRKPSKTAENSHLGLRTSVPHLLDLSEQALNVVRKLRTQGACDAVLATNNLGIAYRISQQRDIPLVVRVSSYTPTWESGNFLEMTNTTHAQSEMEIHTAENAQFVVTPSSRLARVVEKLTHKSVAVVRSPMFPMENPNPWVLTSSRLRVPHQFILFCSALEGIKGAHIAALALPIFLDRHPELSVVFINGRVGRSPDGDSMKSFIERKLQRYAHRVFIVGPLDHGDFFALIKKSSFVIIPSVVDNLPNVLIEAMYFGKVVVGTRESSLDEILEHGVDGLLADPGSVESLAAMMCHAAEMPEHSLQMMEVVAREKALNLFDPDKTVGEILALCARARDVVRLRGCGF